MNNNAIAKGDVLLTTTTDGGEMTIEDGIVEMTGGFETAAFLSLFGGNPEDDGSPENRQAWWGNLLDTDNPFRKMTSRTQNILRGFPATPGNLNRVVDAAKLDLDWFKQTGIADDILITATIPAYQRINLDIQIIKNKTEIAGLEFEQNWIAQSLNTV
jgi:phage gp46-like protein